eukprot:GEMP01067537.1.p1 GENE.GEMP01067537.1~~GEMP01067537.1.p1  ORF type:complete len:142 (+),score=30.39 GEMP01067537.1:63-488(+)
MFLQEVELAFELFADGKDKINIKTLRLLLKAVGIFLSERDQVRLQDEYEARGPFTCDDVLQVIKVSSTEDMQSYQVYTGLQAIGDDLTPLTTTSLLQTLSRIGIPPLTLTDEEATFLLGYLVVEDNLKVNIDELLSTLRFE